MIGPEAFALAHLAIILGLVAWAALSLRQARNEPFRGRRTGARYRRVSTEEVLRRIAHDGDIVARPDGR